MRATLVISALFALSITGCKDPITPLITQPGGAKTTDNPGAPPSRPKEDLAALDKRMQESGLGLFRYPDLLVPDSIRVYELDRNKSQELLGKIVDPGLAWGLRLEHPRLTAEGLKLIKPSSNLKYINVSFRPVGDEGLAALKSHTSLEELHFSSIGATEAGCVHLKPLTKLKRIAMNNNEIADEGFAHLTSLKELASLDVRFTKITDAGMKHIGALKNLKILHLEATAISDEGAKHLYGLKKLTELHLTNNQVTEAGAKKIQAALPGCKIHR